MTLSELEIDMAARLIKFREELKIKQKEVALGSGSSQSHISAMEKGLKQIQPRVIFFLAEKYALNIDWLFTGRGEMKISGTDMVEEPSAKYGRNEIKRMEQQIRDLEERMKKMEGKKE